MTSPFLPRAIFMRAILSHGVLRCVSLMLLALALSSDAAASDTPPLTKPEFSSTMFIISPLAGVNRSELIQPRGPVQPPRAGQPQQPARAAPEMKKTAPEYGLFGLVTHPRFVLNNFLFFTEAARGTDVMGNFFHANLYGDPDAALTWNIGGGHLYHKIEPRNMDIKVGVKMAKAGLVARVPSLGLSFNPYLGYAWESIDTPFGDERNEANIYGLTVDWRWRMLNANFKYHLQDGRDSSGTFHNFHFMMFSGITRNWGAAFRIDHIEQSPVKNTSWLIGPVCVF